MFNSILKSSFHSIPGNGAKEYTQFRYICFAKDFIYTVFGNAFSLKSCNVHANKEKKISIVHNTAKF